MEARVELIRSRDWTRTSCTHERTCVRVANALTNWASQTDKEVRVQELKVHCSNSDNLGDKWKAFSYPLGGYTPILLMIVVDIYSTQIVISPYDDYYLQVSHDPTRTFKTIEGRFCCMLWTCILKHKSSQKFNDLLALKQVLLFYRWYLAAHSISSVLDKATHCKH